MLISFLRDNLQEYGFNIFEATADSDTVIAKVTVQEARHWSDVVPADDIDICVSLMAFYFFTHGVVATQHLERMEWLKFHACIVARGLLGPNEPSPFKQKCHF